MGAVLAQDDLDGRWDLVMQHRERAFRVARARCASPQDVEDCVQEGMARVVGMPDLDPRRVGSLLSVVVANVAVDGYRHSARARRLQDKVQATTVHHFSHEEPICDGQEARWLQAQLSTLPARERDVVVLRAEGLSVGEAAVELGITYKAAESAFTRGRGALKALWRATLAVLAGVFVKPLQNAQHKAPAVAPLALAAAGAALAVLYVSEPPRPVLAQPPPAAVAPAIGVEPGASPPAGRPGPSSAAAPTRAEPDLAVAVAPEPARRTEAEPPSEQVAALPAVDAGPLRRDETTVVREREDETFTETVESCVANGVTISVEEIACR
jgi:RNA polymerase sigma factor (sigma-70 family)